MNQIQFDANRVSVKDKGLSVTGIDKEKGGFVIRLSDNTTEPLDPTSFDMGPKAVFYCWVKKGRFKAGFEGPAAHQLMKHLEAKEGYVGLVVNGLFYPVQREDHAEIHGHLPQGDNPQQRPSKSIRQTSKKPVPKTAKRPLSKKTRPKPQRTTKKKK